MGFFLSSPRPLDANDGCCYSLARLLQFARTNVASSFTYASTPLKPASLSATMANLRQRMRYFYRQSPRQATTPCLREGLVHSTLQMGIDARRNVSVNFEGLCQGTAAIPSGDPCDDTRAQSTRHHVCPRVQPLPYQRQCQRYYDLQLAKPGQIIWCPKHGVIAKGDHARRDLRRRLHAQRRAIDKWLPHAASIEIKRLRLARQRIVQRLANTATGRLPLSSGWKRFLSRITTFLSIRHFRGVSFAPC